MARFLTISLCLALAIGCGGTKNAPETAATPTDDDVKASIVSYLGECGLQEVEVATLAPESAIPTTAQFDGKGWAYKFSASFTNLLGERKTDTDWMAVLTRDAGKTRVAVCLNEARQPMGGKDESIKNREAAGIVAPKP
jgi:flagellar capping protein FliD